MALLFAFYFVKLSIAAEPITFSAIPIASSLISNFE